VCSGGAKPNDSEQVPGIRWFAFGRVI